MRGANRSLAAGRSLALCASIAFASVVTGSVAWAAKGGAALSAPTASVHVFINPRRDTGYPWHGPGDLFVLKGKMVTHLPEAPGAVLCVVTNDGKASCPGQRRGAGDKTETAAAPASAASGAGKPKLPFRLPGKGPKYESPCPSAYDCNFKNIALPPDAVFGVVVIDPAMTLTNLVDAIIVTRRPMNEDDAAVTAFDQRLREAVNALAPPGPFEAKRRLRAFEVRTLDECVKGCKFTQSEMSIEPR